MKCLPSAVTLGPFLSSLKPERNFLTLKQNFKKVNSLAPGSRSYERQSWGSLEWLRLSLELYACPQRKGLRYCSGWLPALLSRALTVTLMLKCLGNLKFMSDSEPSSSYSTRLPYG